MKGFEKERPQTCPPPKTQPDEDGDLPSDLPPGFKRRGRKRLDSIKAAAEVVHAARMVAWVKPESSWHDLK